MGVLISSSRAPPTSTICSWTSASPTIGSTRASPTSSTAKFSCVLVFFFGFFYHIQQQQQQQHQQQLFYDLFLSLSLSLSHGDVTRQVGTNQWTIEENKKKKNKKNNYLNQINTKTMEPGGEVPGRSVRGTREVPGRS